MPSTCPTSLLLPQLWDGRFPDLEAERLEQHLLDCEDCFQALLEMEAATDRLRALYQTVGDPARRLRLGRIIMRLLEVRLEAKSGSDQPDRKNPCAAAGPSPVQPPVLPISFSPPPEPAKTTGFSGFPFLAPPQAADEIGRLGTYRVLRLLGQGGMGLVFLAEDPLLQRLVALKVMRPEAAEKPEARARFLREARATAAIKHDHIVPIYQVGQDHDVPFLAMRLLQGEPLDQWMQRNGSPPLALVLRWGREIALGLAAAHERGLIHRDIKAGNIWLEAPADRVKILDFGLARWTEETSPLTDSSIIMGTPAYMAPEQADGQPVDARCDLFSLGCILYELCTGQMPFQASTTLALLVALSQDTPRPLRELNPGVPASLADLITQLLAKKPADRPDSAKVVARALKAIEPELPTAPSPAVAPLAVPAAPLGVPFAVPVATATFTASPPAPGPTQPPSPFVAEGSERKAPDIRIADDPLLNRVTAPRSATRRRRWLVGAGILGLVLVLGLSGWALLRDPAPGELVLLVNNPDLENLVKRAGVTLRERHTGQVHPAWVGILQLPPGEYDLEVKAPIAGFQFQPKVFTIQSKKQTAIWVGFGKPADNQASFDPRHADLPTWQQFVAALPADRQLRWVSEKLTERNPGFNGQLTPKIDRDVVTELAFSTDQITDIAPVRALTSLKRLECRGSGYQLGGKLPKGKLADLTPLKGMSLTILDCSCNPVRSLTPLQGMSLRILNCDYEAGRDTELVQTSQPILSWRLLGPFADTSREPFDMKTAGSALPDFEWSKTYPGINGKAVSWRNIGAEEAGQVRLHSIWEPLSRASAFAYTTVESTTERDVKLLAGSDDGITLWVNGSKVHENRTVRRPWTVIQDRVQVRLRKGTNTLVVRCDNWTDDWGFSVRIPLGVNPESLVDEAWLQQTVALPAAQQVAPAIAKAAQLPPGDRPLLLKYARFFFQKQKWGPAVPFFDKALAQGPPDVEPLRERGICHVALAQWDKAAADFDRVYARQPKNVRLGFQAAFLHVKAGFRKAYGRVCTRLLEEHRQSTNMDEVAEVVAACLLAPQAVAEPDQVVRLAHKLVSPKPKYSWYHFALGAAHFRAGEYQAAVTSLNRSPLDPSSGLVLAMVYQQLGDRDRARQTLEKAVKGYEQQRAKKPPEQLKVFEREWWEVAVFQTLRVEAEELMKEKEP